MLSLLDKVIEQVDLGLKTIMLPHKSERDPVVAAAVKSGDLSDAERKHSIALMRVNHCGEIAAQALYRSQACVARDKSTAAVMHECAAEEVDHLAWCEDRVNALGGRLSYLRPVWYMGSFAIGIMAGLAGDKYNLGFIDETERQVEAHLNGHLDEISTNDAESIAVIEQMRADEAKHGATAREQGAAQLPQPIPFAMQLVAKLMTRTAYYV